MPTRHGTPPELRSGGLERGPYDGVLSTYYKEPHQALVAAMLRNALEDATGINLFRAGAPSTQARVQAQARQDLRSGACDWMAEVLGVDPDVFRRMLHQRFDWMHEEAA